jgi:hypothetical protein
MKIQLLAALVLITTGCSAAGVSPSVAAPTASPPSTASPSPSPSPSPVIETPAPLPPDAILSLDGGASSVGELGTYTWLSSGSDGPWLPGTPVRVAPGGAVSVSLEPPVAIAAWSIKLAKPSGTDIGARQIAAGTGTVPIAFTVPAQAGTISLYVQFAADAGDATYFWALSPR